MPIHDHEPSLRGRTFLWGGIGLGLLLLVALLTRGFGLLGGSGNSSEGPPLMVRKGDQISIPENSALRTRITVLPAATEALSAKLTLPAIVESDPARTAAVLPAFGGRVLELKVALGERVVKGQALAVIDSPDLAQAYDDNDKAADAANLAEKFLARQKEQSKIGTASEQDLDQAKSNYRQAQAEYLRTQAHLKTLGVSADTTPAARLLTVTAPVGRQHHDAGGDARHDDQRPYPADHDDRRSQHRVGHCHGAGEGRRRNFQEPGRRREPGWPILIGFCTAKCCSCPT